MLLSLVCWIAPALSRAEDSEGIEESAVFDAAERRSGSGTIMESPTGGVIIDFQEAPLSEVIQAMAAITKKRFVYDERIGGTVTIVSSDPVTLDQAFRMFESTLHLKGFTLVEGSSGELLVLPADTAKDMSLQILESDSAAQGRDVFATRIIALKHVKVEAIRETLQQLVSPQAKLIADVHSNTLVVTDSSARIRHLQAVLGSIDVPTFDEKIEVIPLSYADATRLADHLRVMFARPGGDARSLETSGGAGASSAGANASGPGEVGQPSFGGAGEAELTQTRVASGAEPRFVADVGTNSLVVVGAPSVIAEARRIASLLDYKRPGTASLNIYRVKNAEAEKLAKTLTALLQGAPAAASGKDAPVAADALPIAASVRVTADAPTNSLLVQSSPQDYAALSDIIAKLDVRTPQVLIEVLMLEAQARKGEAFGTTLLYNTLHGGLPGGFTSAPSGLLPAALGGSALAPFTTTLIGSTVDVTDALGVKRTVPLLAAVMEAAEKNADTNIISAPQIVTGDNEEARIVVGETRGFPTSRLQAADPSGVSPFQTSTQIERQNVGLTMRVTPQITEGDAVRMRIFTQLSDVTDAANPLGPTTSHRELENTVFVRDGDSVVIGGIIQDKLVFEQRRVPVLGSLPVFGSMFRSESKESVKTNLLLLLTPRILPGPESMRTATEEKRERFRSASDLPRGDDAPSDPNPVRRELDSLARPRPALREEPVAPAPAPRGAVKPSTSGNPERGERLDLGGKPELGTKLEDVFGAARKTGALPSGIPAIPVPSKQVEIAPESKTPSPAPVPSEEPAAPAPRKVEPVSERAPQARSAPATVRRQQTPAGVTQPVSVMRVPGMPVLGMPMPLIPVPVMRPSPVRAAPAKPVAVKPAPKSESAVPEVPKAELPKSEFTGAELTVPEPAVPAVPLEPAPRAVKTAPAPASSAAPTTAPSPGVMAYFVELPPVTSEEQERELAAKIAAQGYPTLSYTRPQGGNVQRFVRVGPYTEEAAARAALENVRKVASQAYVLASKLSESSH